MTNGTGGVFGRGSSGTVREAFIDLQQSERYREYPLQVRASFERVATWLPPREASFPITGINASFAKILRDRACRERGWKFANLTLVLIQRLVADAVEAGALESNRAAQVPKLPPTRQPPTSHRRHIKPVRNRVARISDARKAESSIT